MKLYYEEELSNLFLRNHQSIYNKINNEKDDYLLNVGEEQYILHLKNEHTLNCPIPLHDHVYAETEEREIPASDFPNRFMIFDQNKYFKRDVITYYLPFEGDISLLRYRPSTYNMSIGIEVKQDRNQNALKIEVINFDNNPNTIKQEYTSKLSTILSCHQYLKSDIISYNHGLETVIRIDLQNRKSKLLKTNNLLSSLGVPIKKKSDTASTFSIPEPKLRDKIIVKPVVLENGFKPEPTLDLENYNKILKIMSDVGKNFERLTSVYSDKNEEDLRDHILMILDPNFDNGSATGETFNKKGRTDIQLRHDSTVVFIAECKFWAGKVKMHETIDQLLKYLTWRDSKTAILFFVRNKEISSVKNTVEEEVQNHPHFIKSLPNTNISWSNHIFSLPDDPNKEIKTAIQLFHIPMVH